MNHKQWVGLGFFYIISFVVIGLMLKEEIGDLVMSIIIIGFPIGLICLIVGYKKSKLDERSEEEQN